MPTRYSFDGEFKSNITLEALKDPTKKKELKQDVQKMLQQKHRAGQNKWFFTKLKF